MDAEGILYISGYSTLIPLIFTHVFNFCVPFENSHFTHPVVFIVWNDLRILNEVSTKKWITLPKPLQGYKSGRHYFVTFSTFKFSTL